MAKARSLWGQLFLSSPARVDREEKGLNYIVHRINQGANLHDVLQEPYVRRNCTQAETEEIVSSAELMHACRERLEQTFRSGELDPRRRSQAGRS